MKISYALNKSLMCLLSFFTIIFWSSEGISKVFVHFYKYLKAISSFCFIQIVFIYKWHITIQYVTTQEP